MPERIRLSRRHGWRMPENTVKVDRTTRWGNPWRITHLPLDAEPDTPWVVSNVLVRPAVARFRTEHEARVFSVGEFRSSLLRPFRGGLAITALDVHAALHGMNVACWCALDELCHGDVLLEAAA